MDYVVGSVAALISGNVTPNRPRLTKRALTPTKHQPSPNVTPKSEFVDDRSIFLSPTTQKKKAIIKKSPKRIFQNPDLEASDSNDGNSIVTSPKAEKVKKHLQEDLELESTLSKSPSTLKSPKSKNKSKNRQDSVSSQDNSVNVQEKNEHTPNKKKRKHNSESHVPKTPNTPPTDTKKSEDNITPSKSSKKLKKKLKSLTNESNKENDNVMEDVNNPETAETSTSDLQKTNETPKKKNKKRKKKNKVPNIESTENIEQNELQTNHEQSIKKKNKKRKKSKLKLNMPKNNEIDIKNTDNNEKSETDHESEHLNSINPNAITQKDSDSEHDSDDEMDSENEQINKKVFNEGLPESSDEEEEEKEEPKEKVINKEVVKKDKEVNVDGNTEEEVKRTLFVGNVPFSKKCKKEIKRIFSKHGQIETVRIRTVPIKDGRFTPKLAVIKNELHPERTTVNVYVKFADADSVEKALSENNTVLNDHHLRVSRSSSTGSEHDPRNSVFIGNLPFAMEDEALRAKFKKCGEIESVRIIRDKKTNAGKGFGYVNFKSKDGVELALALSEEDLTVKNRILRVKRCTQLTNKQKSSKPGYNRQKPEQTGYNRGKPNQTSWKGQREGQVQDGAFRRLANKRKNQESNLEGPPTKKQHINQPNKDKKSRKEFVGMTAEKKKKQKFNKGQKKKRALSEILTK